MFVDAGVENAAATTAAANAHAPRSVCVCAEPQGRQISVLGGPFV